MLSRTLFATKCAFRCAKTASLTASTKFLCKRVPVTNFPNNYTQVASLHSKIYGLHHEDGSTKYETDDAMAGDHGGRQQNHIWTKEEIDEELHSLYRHQPVTFGDKIVNKVMYGLYHTFNFVTGYQEGNATVKAIEWRLIVLESIAGVPGFVAAGFRHFRSLRRLKRDHGWIATLLEEAENERMHLLVCLQMFEASWITRAMVMAAQFTMAPILMTVYLFHPRSMHRFVGYLEETACHTYSSVIAQVERPGTLLHAGWAHVPAPEIAKAYWKLPKDAMFVDTLKCMFADECHHRDVNHTFAEMNPSDPNPFALMHKRDALRAHALTISGQTAWPAMQAAIAEGAKLVDQSAVAAVAAEAQRKAALAASEREQAASRAKAPTPIGPGTTEKEYLCPRGGVRADFQVAGF